MPSCKKVERDYCKKPLCKWASGKKRSFCRSAKNSRKGKGGPRSPSGCRKVEKDYCKKPLCKWASGKKRSFCRSAKNQFRGSPNQQVNEQHVVSLGHR